MKAKDLKELADNPNFISGIYNWCDRWCERCAFTARCMTFALGEQRRSNRVIDDPSNAAFWAELHDIFAATLELIHEMAEEQGIDLNAIDHEAISAEEERTRKQARQHAFVTAADAYAKLANRWFEQAGDLFQAKAEELTAFVRMNVAGLEPERQAADIQDAVEVIRWYQLFIQVKLMRALHSRKHDSLAEEHDFPKDSDGSAKIALIALDRSIGAWGLLLRQFPARETETLEILVRLDRLRRAVEREFPQARAFERPGFDTIAVEE